MDDGTITGPDRTRRDLGPIDDRSSAWLPDNAVPGGNTAAPSGGNIVVDGDVPSPSLGRAGPVGSDGRIWILMLAANPTTTGWLALDREAREIGEKLRLARDRDVFELITRSAVRPADLLQYLNEFHPQIVHFSGHGDRAGELVLSAPNGGSQPVGTAALVEMFRVMGRDIQVVILNACHSAAQAQAISPHIDYIVGMRAAVDDESAIVFSAAFYSALGFRCTVREAFEQAVAAVMLHGLPGSDLPELLIRQGADPNLRLALSDRHNAHTAEPSTWDSTPSPYVGKAVISYDHDDLSLVQPIVTQLKRAGIDVWFDILDLRPGADRRREWRRAIRAAGAFVPFFSPRYADRRSTSMNEQLREAVSQAQRMHVDAQWLIPVMLERCAIPDMTIDGTTELTSLHYIDVTTDTAAALKSLIGALRSCVRGPESRGSSPTTAGESPR